jgi:hypothetical protein
MIKNIELRLRRKIRAHVRRTGFTLDRNWKVQHRDDSKETIRALHSRQRRDRIATASDFLERHLEDAVSNFASGHEIKPDQIIPRLELIESGTPECDLFRIASLTWSVPVSQGFGRRMRFLVWDDSIHKVMGIIALGDPVFNLGVRDRFVEWTVEDRCQRLVNVMDAYVLGAVPPYSFILGGKLIACLLRTTELRDLFQKRYSNTCGVISKKKKRSALVMITTTSALGRSSVYNRLRLSGIDYLESLGFTEGFGHFHVDGDLFEDIRRYLSLRKHPYAKDYRFGKGPNWKFRAIRAAFELLNIDRGVLRHGLKREVFACQLAKNAREVLRDKTVPPDYTGLLSASKVSELAIKRWLSPRALRRQEFLTWKREDLSELLSGSKAAQNLP